MGFIVVIAFLALFMMGFPVVYAILLPSIAYVLIEGLPLGLLAQRVTYALDSFPLVAVPLFIFVGNLMNLSGITDRIFRFAYTLVGCIPGWSFPACRAQHSPISADSAASRSMR
jgi:TRAP-type mannitol/chloroaromatic compound transport system permease large subunit